MPHDPSPQRQYLGSLLVALQFGLLALLMLLGTLLAKAMLEERWLREHYPQYAQYCAHRKRFIPWIFLAQGAVITAQDQRRQLEGCIAQCAGQPLRRGQRNACGPARVGAQPLGFFEKVMTVHAFFPCEVNALKVATSLL